MPIKLVPSEIAFYPQPFVESEPNLLVITNQRVVQFGEGGHQEIRAKEVSHLGRVTERPFLPIGAVAAIVGLPLCIVGVYLFFSAGGLSGLPALPGIPGVPGAAKPAAAAAANLADDPSGAAPEAAAEGTDGTPADGTADSPSSPSDPATTRIAGALMTVFGVLFLGGAFFAVRRQDFYVLVRGGDKVLKIRASDKIQQNTLLMTAQAAQSGARPTAVAAPARPKIEVDDKGDPVKALQDLASARQSGKIKDDEFQAKREILLARLNKR